MSWAWPDLLILVLLIIGGIRGLRRGFVSELSGAVALLVALIAAFRYPGMWDGAVMSLTHLGPGSAHVLAMSLFALAAYFIVATLAALLRPLARLPIVGFANALLGAVIGVAKAALFLWAVLYVALFFPLSPDVRADLHRSTLAQLLTFPNRQLDDGLRASLPWYVRPFAGGLFARHRV
ncbi:MAG: CvpA family protein [Candidatus Eremiobacteraeota bacterium]|nr:CvpA family protein [Candidatus Eremiobacteraeota bacterium]